MRGAYQLSKLKLLIVDGAGTLFDPKSIVPAYAFQDSFSQAGYDVPLETIVKFMGREKKEHIRLILKEPEVLAL